MYKDLVILSSTTHKDFRFKPVTNYGFVKHLNSSVIVGQEFMESASHYPIVFSTSKDGLINPVVIMGLSDNLFVDEDGTWEVERYVPAFLRRYPFILAEGIAEDGSLTVCVDTSYQGFGVDSGEPLFTEQGEPSPLLSGSIDFLRLFHDHNGITRDFINHLTGLNLFKLVDATVSLAENAGHFTIRDLNMVDEELLFKLSDEHLAALVRRGYLPWIYAHLHSMKNFSRIINKANHVVLQKKD
ncbi:MAG: SapC family protein [Desulfuromonadaceae bacterium]